VGHRFNFTTLTVAHDAQRGACSGAFKVDACYDQSMQRRQLRRQRARRGWHTARGSYSMRGKGSCTRSEVCHQVRTASLCPAPGLSVLQLVCLRVWHGSDGFSPAAPRNHGLLHVLL